MESCHYHHVNEEEEDEEPVSPTGQYFNSSSLSISILAVLELEVAFDLSLVIPMLKDVFLPINPRFSSIMVLGKKGQKQWKKIEVEVQEHVHIPIFPDGLPPKTYDEYFNNYLSKIATKQFSQTKPLWELHMFTYPTTHAATNMIFKFHHALGDGYSLMGALLSCLHKADNDNSTLPLTFPHLKRRSPPSHTNNNYILGVLKSVPRVLSSVFDTVIDFGSSVLKSSILEDDQSPIRSGTDGVEFSPMIITTMSFSLDHIKQIKEKLGVTLNDVITGVIFLGTRVYMDSVSHGSSDLRSTALIVMNTRDVGGYKTVEDMVKPKDTKTPLLWGNKFCFLHVPLPQLTKLVDPIDFILKTHQVIQRKRNSLAVYLNGWLLELMRKYRGPEVTSWFVHRTLKNSSLAMSNLIGPVEQMALANHPVKGFYFMPTGSPQSLVITMVSYMGQLRVGVSTQRGHIDSNKFKSCIENAFDIMFTTTSASNLS